MTEADRLEAKLELEARIADALAAANEMEPSREQALTKTKLDEAEMWAARIQA